MKHTKPEFPEEVIALVQMFYAAQSVYGPEITREEAIFLIELCAEDMVEKHKMKPGAAHIAIVDRVYAQGASFIIHPDMARPPRVIMHEGTPYAAPSKKFARHLSAGRPRPVF